MRDLLGGRTPPRNVPVDLWVTCRKCGAMHYRPEFDAGLRVCPKCNYHDRLSATERFDLLLDDPDGFNELDAEITAADPIQFSRPGGSYPERVDRARAVTGRSEAFIGGLGQLDGREIALGVMEFGFIAGSMGAATGAKIARLFDTARERGHPLVIVTASGGARQDEGVFALMQLANTTAAAARFGAAGLPYICVMADPTLAGVTASFAAVADVIIGEPGATIRFAGSRVVQGTLRRRGPVEDHTSEWVRRRGMIDMVVARPMLKPTLAALLDLLSPAVAETTAETTAATAGAAARRAGT